MLTLKELIEIANRRKTSSEIMLTKAEQISYQTRTQPEGYDETTYWTFSDGSVVSFEATVDTEPGWKAHEYTWTVQTQGQLLSDAAGTEEREKRGNP